MLISGERRPGLASRTYELVREFVPAPPLESCGMTLDFIRKATQKRNL